MDSERFLLFGLILAVGTIIFLNWNKPGNPTTARRASRAPRTDPPSLPSLYSQSGKDIAYFNVLRKVPVYGKNFPDGKTVMEGVEYGEVEINVALQPDGLGEIVMRAQPVGAWLPVVLVPKSQWKFGLVGNDIIIDFPTEESRNDPEAIKNLNLIHTYIKKLEKRPEVGDLEFTAYLGDYNSRLYMKQILPFDDNPYPDLYV